MDSDPKVPEGDELQFDRAIPSSPGSYPGSDGALSCSACGTHLPDAYYSVDGNPMCAACKGIAEAHTAPVREWPVLISAGLFGLGAAIAGAVIYYGVVAITNFEIGLVAILTGFMVGWAIRKGAGDRGGVRLQVTAAGLTYLSVAVAYFALAVMANQGVEGVPGGSDSARAFTDSLAQPDIQSHDTAVATGELRQGGALSSTLVVTLFLLGLPLIAAFSSMPSGLISLAIIGFGMHQAWRMTGSSPVVVHGPFRVGRGPAASESPSPSTEA
jgi:hypothetical protein